ncbi:c-type cytochrome [Halochromatium roseum]|uniref:c-type cytochrome n=1 Tax=Halochromatium roseum TaxID=391920 RepID=UPI0030841309
MATSPDPNLAEALVMQGDPQRGIEPCAKCHQADGGGSEEVGAPRLAALGADYLANQIQNFRDGNRQHPIMAPWAKLLTEQEITALSAYFAALPPASNAQVPKHLNPRDGAWLALYGNWDGRRLPACQQCHGPLGIGVGEHFPALAGQPYNYLVGQLAAWGTGERRGDHDGMMAAVAHRLTLAEAQHVAAFYAALPAVQAVETARELDTGTWMPSAAGLKPPALVVAPATAPQAQTESEAQPPAKPHWWSSIMPKVHKEALSHQGRVAPGRMLTDERPFQPPSRSERPTDEFGEMVALGESIFSHTYSHQISGQYVGNDQVCEGCHLDGGRLANAAPMWAAWVAYPAYRAKNNKVNTLTERIQGCFAYSMNAQASEVGHPPAADSTTVLALTSYLYWLAQDAPTGDRQMPGRGFPALAQTEQGFDPDRGEVVYAKHCAVCHGEEGEGGYAGTEMVFPPLWGERSYNWGAGMHRIDTAAAFIKTNMPLGNYLELSDQQAWDVAAYINSQERPQDPRFNGDLAETTERFHGGEFDYYGVRKARDGRLLGSRAMSPPASAAQTEVGTD